MKASLFFVIFVFGCKSAGDMSSVKGYENNRRAVGVTGLMRVGQSQAMYVTGRTSMGSRDPNQCEAAYSGDEMVDVTYIENGTSKRESLYITGINNKSFGTDQNGLITDACGTVIEVTFDVGKGRAPLKKRFVVVDRIWEGHAQSRPNLDIAARAYYEMRQALGHNDNFNGMNVRTVALGSYTYAQNSDCTFQPGVKNPCGNGW
jgi:hypothetical protein